MYPSSVGHLSMLSRQYIDGQASKPHNYKFFKNVFVTNFVFLVWLYTMCQNLNINKKYKFCHYKRLFQNQTCIFWKVYNVKPHINSSPVWYWSRLISNRVSKPYITNIYCHKSSRFMILSHTYHEIS